MYDQFDWLLLWDAVEHNKGHVASLRDIVVNVLPVSPINNWVYRGFPN